MAIRLKQEGEHDFVLLERASEIGGTWRDNTYPGCRCDVPSHLYSFSFAPNPNWSSTFSPQPEILDYLKDSADRHGVLPHMRFETELEAAEWDDERAALADRDLEGPITADVLIAAQGPLVTLQCRRSRASTASRARRSTRPVGPRPRAGPASAWP